MLDIKKDLNLIWNVLDQWAEVCLGGRIGNGEKEYKDDEHQKEWQEICEAMAHISEELGLSTESTQS